MTMTLEQVKNQLRHRSDDPDYRTLTNETANEMADAIDAYLVAVREVIASHRREIELCNKHDQESIDYLTEQTDKLEAAIKGAA
ncbi:MAG TPA: hypothetical protein VN731_10335 [Rhodanobacter sp.]|nr:hypothetical protein [Rhodanobacter sp.]